MVNNKEQCWERLDRVIKWSDMTINHFARHIGIKRGENLYQIKRGHNGISRKLAEAITMAFPQINLSWLLSGNGEMFVDEAEMINATEFYDVDAENNIRFVGQREPASLISLPSRIKADIAMMHYGHEMPFSIPSNTLVLLKLVDVRAVVPGREYLVVTPWRAHLRKVIYLEKHECNMDYVRLISDDRERFDDIVIKASDVTEFYQVVAKMTIQE